MSISWFAMAGLLTVTWSCNTIGGLGMGHVYGHHSRSSTEAGTGMGSTLIEDKGESQSSTSDNADRGDQHHSQDTELGMDQTQNYQQPRHLADLGTSGWGGDGSLEDASNNPNRDDQFNQCGGQKAPDPMHKGNVPDGILGRKQDEFEELRKPQVYQRSGRGRRLTSGEESDRTDSGLECDDDVTWSMLLQNLDADVVNRRNSAMDDGRDDWDQWQPEEVMENELDDMYGNTQDQESTSYD
jgi:hypothetical protein